MNIHTLGLLTILFPATSQAAVVTFPTSPVDWLVFSPSVNSLVDDNNTPIVTLDLTTDSGIALPVSAGTLNNNFWTSPPAITDSLTGDASIPTFEIRHIPTGGAPDFQLNLLLPREYSLILAIGQLFADDNDATNLISITSPGSTNPQAVDFLGSFSSDNGLIPFDQPLNWNPANNQLNPTPGNDGESQIAFFRIENTDQLTIDFPSAYSQSTGDTITIALASLTPVPEPSSLALLALSALFLGRHRRSPVIPPLP